MELTEKITIDESNLADATKYEYNFRLGQFYNYTNTRKCPSYNSRSRI